MQTFYCARHAVVCREIEEEEEEEEEGEEGGGGEEEEWLCAPRYHSLLEGRYTRAKQEHNAGRKVNVAPSNIPVQILEAHTMRDWGGGIPPPSHFWPVGSVGHVVVRTIAENTVTGGINWVTASHSFPDHPSKLRQHTSSPPDKLHHCQSCDRRFATA